MKETSVAGESPDKSDKKQSSGKTARNERDPRLSAFRGKPDESAQASDTGKHPKPEDDGAEAAAESKSAAKPEPVAAAKSASTGKPDSASEAESSVEPAGGSEPVAVTEAEPGAGSASEGASEEPQEAEEGGAGAEGGDARLRAAVAAWVAGSGDEDGEGGEGAEGAEAGEGGDGDAGDAAASASEVKAEAEAEAEAESAAGADEATGADAGAAAKPEAKADAKADAKPGAESGAKQPVKSQPKGKGEPKGKGKSEAEGKPESGSKPEAQGESDSEGKPASPSKAEVVDQPTAVFKTVEPQKGKPSAAAGAASEGNGDGKGGEAAEAEEPAVDEATRVFAFAKSKKGAEAEAVDQATTAFKISPPAKDGDAAKSTAKDKPESKGKADAKADAKDKNAEGKDAGGKGEAKAAKVAERDSERTSQFVALKSADDGTAGKSLGKTAPKTPARTPDKAADKAADKPADKPADKSADKAADKAADKPEGKVADKPADKADKAGAKPAGKASGALPAAEPAKSAKPAAAPKPADRPGTMPPATTGATAAAPAELPEAERTKQQPLPPLDLLAQLTNTPPPPETPLRSAVRRFKIWTPLAVLLAIIFVVAQAVRPLPNPTLTVGDAKSSFTFEGGKLAVPWPAQGQAAVKVVGSGDLGTFGPQKPVPTASVAKIMTAYVVLRDHPLKKGKTGPQIEVDAKAVTEGGSRHESRIEGLKAGQKFSQQDMIKMLMIPSGNNIARLLARWDTKSDNEAAFVKKMNAAAKDLGMKNTTYTDPSGLDPKTVSTAVDQLKLAEAVMKFDAFRPIVATPNADIPGLPKRINSNIDNLLLAGLSIKGIKTGSSTAAGGTLSWAAYKTVDGKDHLILGTMMDQHFKGLDPDGANSLTLVKNNSQKVIEAVRNALTSATAVKKGQVVGYVDDGLNGLTPVVATKDLKAVGVPGQKLKLSVGDGGKTVPHTAKAGTEVGVLTVGNGESSQKVPVALQEDLVEPSFGAKLVRIT
ncbi:D-alanyl-D-alanine carboxypeptidase [Streptomyces platensis]|uniref:D-alanyl-D-alanine carboxypeptidase family protein n=1 Tax=Streptomyces platensis TaxID=58346 RepID=UPI002ED204A3|nr:D-alanyl-D-alanine carboxypeptidase [Streptomyces platensis]